MALAGLQLHEMSHARAVVSGRALQRASFMGQRPADVADPCTEDTIGNDACDRFVQLCRQAIVFVVACGCLPVDTVNVELGKGATRRKGAPRADEGAWCLSRG